MISEISTKAAKKSPMRIARDALGITQKEAAARMGVSKFNYQQWESGKVKPKAANAERIAQVLHLPIESIEIENRHKPFHKQSLKVVDEKQAMLMERYAPYRERRIELGLTQAELAQRAGLKADTISTMETGKNEPLWKTRQAIRKALGWPEELYYTVEERNKLLLEMESTIKWVLKHHKEYFREANVDLEDAYQDLTLRAILSIDRYQPSFMVPIRTFVLRQLMFEAKTIRRRAIAKGLTGKGSNYLPFNMVTSLEDANPYGDKTELEAVA